MKLSQAPPVQVPPAQVDEHVRLTAEDYLTMVRLLERYHTFAHDFVFSCQCERSTAESMHYGKMYNDLDREFKHLMEDLGQWEAPPQVMAPKKLPPEEVALHQARLLQQQPGQATHRASQLSPNPSQSNQQQQQQQSHPPMSFASTNSATHHLASTSGLSSSSSYSPRNHLSPHQTHHIHLPPPPSRPPLSRSQPPPDSEPLTTTITLSTDDDDEQSSDATIIENNHHHPQPPTSQPTTGQLHSLSVDQLKEIYLKNLQQPQLQVQSTEQHQQQQINAELSQIRVAQQNGHLALQGNSTLTFPIIKNETNESILIPANLNLSSSLSIASTSSISSHIVSTGREAVFTSPITTNGLPQGAIQLVSRSQPPAPPARSTPMESQPQVNLLKIVRANGHLATVANSRASYISTIASTSNGITHLATSSSPNHLRVPSVVVTSSTMAASTPNRVHHHNQPHPQRSFQTVEQLEAAQFSPVLRQPATPQTPHQPAAFTDQLIRPSSVSPVVLQNGTGGSSTTSTTIVAPTQSVIHQAYVLSRNHTTPSQRQQQQASPAPPPILVQTASHHQQQQPPAAPQPQPPRSASAVIQVSSAPSPASPQQQQTQQILIYPPTSGAPNGCQQAVILQRPVRLPNGEILPQGAQLFYAPAPTPSTPTPTRQLEVAKTFVATGQTSVVTALATAAVAQDTSPFLSSLAISPDTPPSTHSISSVATLNLSSSSSSSSGSSSSSLNSLITKTLLSAQSSPELPNQPQQQQAQLSPTIKKLPHSAAVSEDPDTVLLLEQGITGPDVNGFWRCNFAECTFAAVSRCTFVSHIRKAHHMPRPYKCPQPGCNATFKEKYKLKVHSVVHTRQKPFKCDWPGCTAKFSQSGHVSRHRKTHMGTAKYVCTWPSCTRSFIQKHTLKNHMMMHKGEKPWVCQIDNCGRSFIEKWKLVKHQKSHNSSQSGQQPPPAQSVLMLSNNSK